MAKKEEKIKKVKKTKKTKIETKKKGFLAQVKDEMKKVSWPTFKDVMK